MKNFLDVTSWYKNWLDVNKLPQQSADEVLYGRFNELTSVQSKILYEFILVWDELLVKNDSLTLEENFSNWISENKIKNIDDCSPEEKKLIVAYKNITFLMNNPNCDEFISI